MDRDWLLSPGIIVDRSTVPQQCMGRRSSHLTVGEHIISTMRQSSTGLNGQAVAFVSLFHDDGGGHDAPSGSRHRALEGGDQGWQLAI